MSASIRNGDYDDPDREIEDNGEMYNLGLLKLAYFESRAKVYVDLYNYYADFLELYQPDENYNLYLRADDMLYQIGADYSLVGLQLKFLFVYSNRYLTINSIQKGLLDIVNYVMTNIGYNRITETWFDLYDEENISKVIHPVYATPGYTIEGAIADIGPKAAIRKK